MHSKRLRLSHSILNQLNDFRKNREDESQQQDVHVHYSTLKTLRHSYKAWLSKSLCKNDNGMRNESFSAALDNNQKSLKKSTTEINRAKTAKNQKKTLVF